MADKYEYEKRKKEKMEEVKARLDFGDARKKNARVQESAYSESRTISPRRQRRSSSPRRNPSVFTRLRRERSRSPRHEYKNKERRESTVFTRLGSRGRSTSVHSDSRQESSSVEDDNLSQPWVCAKTDPYTSRIHHFDFPKTRMPSHVKTYNGSEDPEDHLKIFQADAKMERWAMPTWCHMFNSTLTGNARVWFDDLPPESIDSYNDLRKAFLKNYLQQKKCIRDPIMLHNIKQRDGESTDDFIKRYKSESGNVKGVPECMRISGFVHGITNPELIKRVHKKIPKIVDEIMQVATSFLQGQKAASNQERKKAPQAWRHQEGGHRQNFKKRGGFRSQHKTEKRLDRFTLLTKTPKEILALEKGKFKTPPPMTTPVEKRNANKFCEFHGEVGHNTDECNHLRKQIEDMLKAGKLSHIIRELKQFKSGKNSENERNDEHSTSAWIDFMVVRSTSPFNGIIGRPGLQKMKAVPLTTHRMIKFPVMGGSLYAEKQVKSFPSDMFDDLRTQKDQTPSVEQKKTKSKLCNLLQRSLDIFAWTPTDMTGVPRQIAEHKLSVWKGCPPVRQKKKGQAAERNIAINDEVSKLVTAGIMREVHYYDWLSNPVMVKKSDNSWRMCVDFQDLNKAYPKDGYPLQEIDWKVESLCGFPFKYFMNAYKGYHQIQMTEEDEEKTEFITRSRYFLLHKNVFRSKKCRCNLPTISRQDIPWTNW
ncbi:reverse transcriptase domain-containing protein [Tanacetum coccineum]